MTYSYYRILGSKENKPFPLVSIMVTLTNIILSNRDQIQRGSHSMIQFT